MAIGLALGGVLGMIAGYRPRHGRHGCELGSYVLAGLPALVAVIAIVTFWATAVKITIVIGVASAPLISGSSEPPPSPMHRDFVMAAKALGASDTRILLKEILPNIMPSPSPSPDRRGTIVVLEGSLAFLGSPYRPHAVVGQHVEREPHVSERESCSHCSRLAMFSVLSP